MDMEEWCWGIRWKCMWGGLDHVEKEEGVYKLGTAFKTPATQLDGVNIVQVHGTHQTKGQSPAGSSTPRPPPLASQPYQTPNSTTDKTPSITTLTIMTIKTQRASNPRSISIPPNSLLATRYRNVPCYACHDPPPPPQNSLVPARARSINKPKTKNSILCTHPPTRALPMLLCT